jgi:hypothetical protein
MQLTWVQLVLGNSFVRRALIGFAVAAWADFRVWKSFDDCKFNFKLASWRWLQGAVGGLFVGTGLDSIS